MGMLGAMGWQGAIVLVLVAASCVYLIRQLLAKCGKGEEAGGCSCGAAKHCAARKKK